MPGLFSPSAPRMGRIFLTTLIVALALLGLNACAQSPQQAVTSGAAMQTPATSKSPANPLAARTEQLKQNVLGNLVFLKGGTFEMGDWGLEVGDKLPYDIQGDALPLHKVTLDGFSMMAYKVTYDDFDLFTDAVGEQRINQDSYGLENRVPRKPVGVNWYGAKAYCEWLGKLTGQPFALPTEAQWEYAARSGGQRVLFATDNGNIDKGHNYPDSWRITDEDEEDERVPYYIGTYPPNPAGLFGMLDNLSREWVNDWYDPDYYQISPELSPKGPDQGSIGLRNSKGAMAMKKVLRGLRGSNPELGGFVFSRGSDAPQIQVWREGKEGKLMPDDWSAPDYQFRCVVNSTVNVGLPKAGKLEHHNAGFRVTNETGQGVQYVRYRIKDQQGNVLAQGLTGPEGHTARVYTSTEESVSLFILDD